MDQVTEDKALDRHYHVFISYSHKDADLAEDIQYKLEEQGISCFRDSRICAGKEWDDVVRAVIGDADVFLLLATDSSAESKWVHNELTWLKMENRHKLLPVLVEARTEAANLPSSFKKWVGRIHYLSLYGQDVSEVSLRRILEGLRGKGVGVLNDKVDQGLNWHHLDGAFGCLTAADRQRLDDIAAVARRAFQTSPGHPTWTVHGLRHANGLLYALTQLLDESQRADRHTAFCAVAAACLHDIGLVMPEFHERFAAIEKKRPPGVDVPKLRAGHAACSAEWVKAHAGELQLNGREMNDVAELAGCHNPTANIHRLMRDPGLSRLGAAFLIANICDMGSHRAPAQVWKQHHERICDAGQMDFWITGQMLSAVLLDREARTISVCGRAPKKGLAFIPKQFSHEIERRLAPLRPLLGPWDVKFEALEADAHLPFPIEDIVRNSLRLQVDQQPVVSSSSELADYFLQAAQHMLTQPRAENDPKDVVEKVHGFADHLIAKRGELHLLHWLKLSLPALDTEREAAELLADTQQAVRSRSRERGIGGPLSAAGEEPESAVFHEITKSAVAELKKADKKGLPHRLFLFGCSGPVTDFVRSLAGDRRELEVYTPVMRPVGEGPDLKVVEALSECKGCKVHVVPDASILRTLSVPRGKGRALVLMGCEAVFTRGRARQVAIGTSLGARMVAELAKQAGARVWVLTDTSKFYAYRKLSPWYRRNPRVSALDAEDFVHEPTVSAQMADLRNATEPPTYPRSEVVPGELIDLIITEEGPLTPEDAVKKVKIF